MLSLLNNELYEGGKKVDLKGAKIRDIYHLCTEINENKNDEKGKLCVRVPYYQRPYKWGEDQIKELFSDYAENSDNSKGKKDSIFTGISISPGVLLRQCSNHYAFRAGRN